MRVCEFLWKGMKYMRIKAFILAFVLIFSAAAPAAAADNEPVFYFNAGFSKDATYSAPSELTVSGKYTLAKIVPGGLDKAVILKNRDSKLKASASFAVSADLFYLQTRIKLADTNSEKTISLSSGGATAPILKLKSNMSITSGNDVKIGAYKINEWIDLGFKIDTVSGKCDIYLQGKPAAHRIDIKSKTVAEIVIESGSCTKESAMYVDYIRAYSANKLLEVGAFQYETNNETSDDTSLDIPQKSDEESQLLIGYDFEDEAEGIVPDGFWAKNSPYIAQRDDGAGKAFLINRTDPTVSGENYIDLLTNVTLTEAVLEIDVYNPLKSCQSRLFTLRDRAGHFATLLYIGTNGSLMTSNGQIVANGLTKKWTNVAVALDFSERSYDVYVDRELAAENISIPNDAIEDYIQLVRFQADAGGKEKLWIDNMFVYTGGELQPFAEKQKAYREEVKKQQELEAAAGGGGANATDLNPDYSYFSKAIEDVSASPSSYLGGYDEAKKLYSDSLCLVARNNALMIKGEKYTMPYAMLYENMTLLAPVRALGAAYGLAVSYDADNRVVKLGDDITLKIGDSKIVKGGEEIPLEYPIKEVDGCTFVELRAFAEKVLHNYMHQSELGIAVISKQRLSYAPAGKALNYIVFDRPNANTLYRKLVENYPMEAHPRALYSLDEFAKAKELAATDARAAGWSATTLTAAENYLKVALPEFAYDSSNTRVQNLISRSNVLNAYWAYDMTGDKKYAEDIIKRALACCEYPTWGADRHFLEVGSTTGALGLVIDLFYDEISQSDKNTIAEAMIEMGIKPAIEHYYGRANHNWPTNSNNWNIVCNAGIIIGCLSIMDEYETDICSDALEKAIKSTEAMMSTFAPEGAWGEGAAYWDYTVSHVVEASRALENVYGTDFGIMEVPGVLETGYYPFQMSGNAGMFAYHDAPRVYVLSGSADVLYIAKRSNDKALAGLQLLTMDKNGAVGGLRYLLNYDPEYVEEAASMDIDCLYSSSQVATVRSGWDSNAVWLGIHAGANDFPHGHVDLGTFEYEANGARFASEMGKDDYNLPGYWDVVNRNLYITRAEGHNVYVINPDMGAGQEVRAHSEIKQIEKKPQGSIYTIDMTPAYIKNVSEAQRGFMLSNHRKVFTVQDEIVPQGNDEYYWFWHTVANVEVADDGRSVTLTNSGKKVTLYFDSNVDFAIEKGLSLPLPTSPKVDAQLGGLKQTINKITVRFRSAAKEKIFFRATAVPDDVKYIPDKEITLFYILGS